MFLESSPSSPNADAICTNKKPLMLQDTAQAKGLEDLGQTSSPIASQMEIQMLTSRGL